jgi:restriction endonuclease Mrr
MTRRRAGDGILITCSDFTPPAQEVAREAQQLQLLNGLVNGPRLVQLLAEHGVGLRFGKYGDILLANAR